MRYLLSALCGAWLAAPAAFADAPADLDHDALEFVFDFCGDVIGRNSAALDAATAKLHNIIVALAQPLQDSTPDLAKAVTASLELPDGSPVHRVTFQRVTQGTRATGYLGPNLTTCLVVVKGATKITEMAIDRLATPPSAWQEIYVSADARGWQRTLDDGRVLTVTIVTSPRVHTVSVKGDMKRLPTIVDFVAFANAIVEPCSRSALNGGKIDAAKFAAHFNAERVNADGSTLLVSKRDLPGGQLLLIPEPWGHSCVFAVDNPDSFDLYRRAFTDAFRRLKGAARSQGTDQRWLAPGPNPDNWVAMEENPDKDKDRLMLMITRD